MYARQERVEKELGKIKEQENMYKLSLNKNEKSMNEEGNKKNNNNFY